MIRVVGTSCLPKWKSWGRNYENKLDIIHENTGSSQLQDHELSW